MGQGIGRSLLDHPAERAAARSVPALTLTMFAAVPWSAPCYARCGFQVLDDDLLSAGRRTSVRAKPLTAWTSGRGCPCIEERDGSIGAVAQWQAGQQRQRGGSSRSGRSSGRGRCRRPGGGSRRGRGSSARSC
ncbi:hypothetical protein ACFW2C_22385 [Streptomyces sp. NPDC058875]|uniref:hypothetical protein n=1 Tax=Streptomyces sp. NPDC058875 TaxID=3346663 RepID=UPI003697359E